MSGHDTWFRRLMTTSRRHKSLFSARWIAATITVVLLAAAVVAVIWWGNSRAQTVSAVNQSQEAPSVPAESGPPATRPDGLPAATTLGLSELKVRDLPAVLEYYRDAVGLTVFEESDAQVVLGVTEPLLRLVQSDEPLPSPQDAGLYHHAILFADAPALATALSTVASAAPESYQGAADHRVSRAFYFADPEGNGVELYVDRPRGEWVWEDGKVLMGSEPLDPNEFMREYLGQDSAGTATMGHVHLKVGDLDQARAFYADTLGFDVVSETEGALFYSAGGYHHHLATNTWGTAGAGPRTTEVGLGSITIALPDSAGVDAVAARLDAAAVGYERIEGGIVAADPWGNRVRLIA